MGHGRKRGFRNQFHVGVGKLRIRSNTYIPPGGGTNFVHRGIYSYECLYKVGMQEVIDPRPTCAVCFSLGF